MLRLLHYDYQRIVRYYTIYRTFKQQPSDDFTTILRLFAGRNYDYWLRLFQPERYDYCSPLLAIGRKPEKRCGESRQWFRAACRSRKKAQRQTCARSSRFRSGPVSMPGSAEPRRADPVQVETLPPPGWHGLPSYIPYYNRRLCWPVQRPAWRWSGYRWRASGRVYAPPAWYRWYYSRLCRSGIVGG